MVRFKTLVTLTTALSFTCLALSACSSKPNAQGVSPTPENPPAALSHPVPLPVKGELFQAVKQLNVDAVRQLLNNGADPNENLGTDEEPLTPLWLATALSVEDPNDSRARSMMSILRYRGASPFIGFEGYTALDLAIDSGQDDLVKTLLFNRGDQQ